MPMSKFMGGQTRTSFPGTQGAIVSNHHQYDHFEQCSYYFFHGSCFEEMQVLVLLLNYCFGQIVLIDLRLIFLEKYMYFIMRVNMKSQIMPSSCELQ